MRIIHLVAILNLTPPGKKDRRGDARAQHEKTRPPRREDASSRSSPPRAKTGGKDHSHGRLEVLEPCAAREHAVPRATEWRR